MEISIKANNQKTYQCCKCGRKQVSVNNQIKIVKAKQTNLNKHLIEED